MIWTDQLPGLAARWLAADLAEAEAVRMLAEHSAHNPAVLEDLLSPALGEGHRPAR